MKGPKETVLALKIEKTFAISTTSDKTPPAELAAITTFTVDPVALFERLILFSESEISHQSTDVSDYLGLMYEMRRLIYLMEVVLVFQKVDFR